MTAAERERASERRMAEWRCENGKQTTDFVLRPNDNFIPVYLNAIVTNEQFICTRHSV